MPTSRNRDSIPNSRRTSGFGRNVTPILAARQARHERPSRRRRTPIYGLVAFGLMCAFAAPIALQGTGIVDLRLPAAAGSSGSPNVINVRDVLAAKAETPSSGRSIPICSGGRRLTCIVDGDTGWHEGEKWRLVARSGGVDAPEIGKPECAAEKAAGNRATRRLQSLMSGGYTLSGSDYDRYDRRLVVVTLADGRDAGSVLIDEGLAQDWPNNGNPWCGR